MQRFTIEINDLRLYAHHGVMEQEQKCGNEFSVTVHLDYPALTAAAYDDIDGTLNYAEAVALIKEEMAIPSQLLENAAARILQRLTHQWLQIDRAMVRIAKLAPPIPNAQLADVAVTLHWTK